MTNENLVLTDEDFLAIEREACERSLATFTKRSWHVIEPATRLIWNWHLDALCAYIEAFYRQDIPKLILNVPPGSMKSILFSVTGPAWAWAKWPHFRMLNMTNEEGLARRDGQRMLDIIQSDWFQELWGEDTVLTSKKPGALLYDTTQKGFRQGLGLSGNISGKRGNFILLDDPVDTKKAFSDQVNSEVNNTYDQAVSTRLNSIAKDCIGLIQQRTREDDLTGHLMKKKATSFVQVRIPMEYEGEPGYDPVKDLGPEYAHLADPRTKEGELMFPERFPRSAVEALKEDLGSYGTASQLQQRPEPLGGAIIKKTFWQKWPKDQSPPFCVQIFDSWDTAYTEKDYKEAAYSARTTWGIFEEEATGRHAMIMLGRWYGRVGYPELKKEMRKSYKMNGCDRVLIEKKASGISLYQDARRIAGISVRGFNPGRLDKIARAHLATPMMEAGLVFIPDGRAWAEDVVERVSKFPMGAAPCADLTDTITQAIIYVRNKGWAQPPDNDRPEDVPDDLSEEQQEDGSGKRKPAYG